MNLSGVYRDNEEKGVRLPSGKTFRYIEIIGKDGKPYNVIEGSGRIVL
jgi:hypothetical protein